jgi:uncharacterized phosphosugar-binding protein
MEESMTGTVPIDQTAAADVLRTIFDRVVQTQRDAISSAAKLVVEAFGAGGIIQVFGTGHSRAFVMEIAGRAGGLIPANPLSIKDLVMYGGAPPGEILDPLLERDPAFAARILDLADIDPADVFVIASNSGGNGSVVEFARLVRERGHRIVAVTSLDHSSRITSRHPSGKRLFELADVVIDNCGVLGDAALPLPTGGAITATSSFTTMLIAQLLVAEVCGLLLRDDQEVPVFISANMPGGDQHNETVLARYRTRVRLGEP